MQTLKNKYLFYLINNEPNFYKLLTMVKKLASMSNMTPSIIANNTFKKVISQTNMKIIATVILCSPRRYRISFREGSGKKKKMILINASQN